VPIPPYCKNLNLLSVKPLASLFLAVALSACSGKPYVVEPASGGAGGRSTALYVVSHGWHAGLVVPAERMNRIAPELKQRFGDVAYYEIGWGDKGFYQAQEITVGLTLQAMFWSQGAVLHVVGVPVAPAEYFSGSEVIETCLTGDELDSLSRFVASSFVRDAGGGAVSLSKGIYGDSQFYDGVGRYYLLNTCNKWTAKALSSAGMDIAPTFKLTSGSVMGFLRTHGRACANLNVTPQLGQTR